MDDKHYQVEHGEFYTMLCKYKGMKHLATLIHKICQFLKKLDDKGLVYGNLRAENIMVKFDRYRSRIEQIRFLDFGCSTTRQDLGEMVLPVRLDHIPPEMLQHLNTNLYNESFLNKTDNTELMNDPLEAPSFDVFSLGMLLLNIIAGRPH